MASKGSKAAESSNGRADPASDMAMAIASGSGDRPAAGRVIAGSGSGGKGGSRVRDLTLTALLGVFILAVFVAVARHFLPGRLSGLVGRAMERADKQ